MGGSTRQGPWLPEEDATLLSLVHLQGPHNWVRISQHMRHRNAKQCRERYHQNLKPHLNRDPISPEEGEIIEQLVQDIGKRWAEIARCLGNRSDNTVKNWWNGSVNRRKRNTSQTVGRSVGPRCLPVPATGSSRTGPHNEHNAKQTATSRRVTAHVSAPYAIPKPVDERVTHQRDRSLASGMGPADVNRVENQHVPSGDRLRPRQLYYGMNGNCEEMPRMSAPPSIQTSSYPPPLLPLQLPPLSTALRAPMLNHRSVSCPEWQSHRSCDAPALSPAVTEFSPAQPYGQAPSLVSDNLSQYSISPRTISSPRPGLAISITASDDLHDADQRRSGIIGHGRKEAHVDKLSPETGVASVAKIFVEGFPLDPSLTSAGPYTAPGAMTAARSRTSASPGLKDSRMNVSNLLG